MFDLRAVAALVRGPGGPNRLICHLKSLLGVAARIPQHQSHSEDAVVTTTFEIAFTLPPADRFINLVLLAPDVVGITITTQSFHKVHHLRGDVCGQLVERGHHVDDDRLRPLLLGHWNRGLQHIVNLHRPTSAVLYVREELVLGMGTLRGHEQKAGRVELGDIEPMRTLVAPAVLKGGRLADLLFGPESHLVQPADVGYGPNRVDLRRRTADFVARIFRGTPAGELPIEDPTTFELIINLKTARALGIDLPTTLLAQANEVIE